MNQGFDYYFDKFDLSKYISISLGNVQRRGDEVIDEVLKWFEGNRPEKFFIWIHLFDPHTPYEPPSPYKERYPDRPYIGEIAFADSQLGRLWSYLEENNLIDKTFFVFAADHGESLDEHQESTHGFFVYQEGIHVPLIFVTPFKKLQGISRENVVSLVDVMPTVLQMANLQVPAQVQGMSLLPLFFKETELERDFAYSETFYPRFHFGWSELQTIQEKKYKLIIAPELELYDLMDDPDEQKNLVSVRPEETRRLMRKAEQFIENSSHGAFELDYRNLDEEARQKLAALGYIGSFMDSSSLKGRRLDDPKKKIGVFNRLSRAKEMGLEGDVEEALRMVNEIINEYPEVIDAYFTMGNLYFKEHRFKEALESFFKVLDKKPGDAFTVINIANSYVALGNFNEAEKFLSSVIDSLPPDSQIYFILGNIKNIKEEYSEAIRYYQECIKLNPASASAYSELGGIYVIQENFSEAEKFLENARELNSSLRNLHYYLAQIYEERGDLIQAADEYREELENNPSNFRACFNLSRIYRLRGDNQNEEVYLLKTIELNPDYPYSYFYLARIYLNQGEKYAEAISLVKRGIEAKPLEKYLPVGYFLLADLYYRLGQESKSREYTRKGRESVQNNSP